MTTPTTDAPGPATLRDELVRLIVTDLRGPSSPTEELPGVRSPVRDWYLLGKLAPKGTIVDPSRPGTGLDPMAGLLLYTSAPDAEGTLGGLVSLGRPHELAPIISATLERARLCSSDPLCSEHQATTNEDALHNAACHACLFVSETSCERGNRYLDRSMLVDTFTGTGTAFFR